MRTSNEVEELQHLEVLHVPGCPNLGPLLERLPLPVVTRVIESEADAARFGMAGSPTLLVDGTDPFAADGECGCSVSCRLYPHSDGRIVSTPSVEQLRAVLVMPRSWPTASSPTC